MTAQACKAVLVSTALVDRAPALDAAFPLCTCEQWSLAEAHPDAIDGAELVARILTSPDGYDEETNTILTGKLTDIYSLGLSVIRQGASDEEILSTIEILLTRGQEMRMLKGAILMQASDLRSYDGAERWFGVYATDDGDKTHHGEVLGTFPALSKSQVKKATSQRRYRLAEDLVPHITFAETAEELLANLRAAGF